MPKKPPSNEARAFGERLSSLMQDRFPKRRGAGAWLARKYHVSTVTANGWLKGEYKPETDLARRIADDHGTTFDYLYFGKFNRNVDIQDDRGTYAEQPEFAADLRQITLALTAFCDWIRETRPVEAPLLAENLTQMARLDGSLSDRSPIGVMLLALKGAKKPLATGNAAPGSKKRTTARSHRP